MSTRTPAPRVTNPHPNSLASLLSSWHLTDSPVKVENWRTKRPGGPAKSTSGPEQVLRKKDQPRCFIFDRHLVPSTWASFTSFLERNALPPYYADSALLSQPGDPRTFLSQIWVLRSLWQAEPVTDYSEDSFKWSELRSIPVAWVESLDLVLPPDLRAGRAAQEGQRPFRKRQRDSQGVEVLYTTRADGVFYKEGSVLIVVEDKHARASWPPDEYVPLLEEEEEGQEEEDGIFRRLLDYFLDKGPILTAREFYDLTRRGDPHVFSLLTKAIVSCTSRSARYFVLEDPLRAKRQRDSQGVEVLYTTRADGVFYKEGSVLIVVEDKHARASWPPDEYVPLLEEEEEGQEEEDGIFRRLLDYFLDKGPILTAREFYDLTRRGDPHVFSLLTKAIVSCTSRSARYFVLEDPLRAIFGALVPVNDPHEEIGKGDFDVVLSTMLPLTSSSPPFPQFVSSLYYNGETIRKLHSERAATLIVKHDRQADVEAESSRAPVAAAGRITRSMAGVGYEIAPAAGPSGRQATNLTILSESPTFLLVYPDGATPANPLLRRISSAGDDSLPTSDTSFGSEEDGHRAYSSDSHDAPPSPPRPKHELSPFPPTKTSTSENDEKPVILQIFDWIGLGTTSYAYEARTVGEKPTRYVIKVARRGRDPEEDAASFLCEAAILERLKDVEWVCHTYAYLEGADPKCRSVLLMEFGGEAIEKWEDLSRGERLELYQNVVTLHTEYGLAHNDLRPPNVVVDPPPSETTTTPTADHKRRVRLIDFVWASEHECEGEAACEELLVFRRALGL
ncbi:hypothetical protein Rt10032_c18g6100 [Rhodotorula toruloides]|uniref:Protein kinase domain-containing protein n=1 Tax=Rhodotorula toruloides TaxID=5286 RepID=A0A511KNY2_RHOTO|nr:hypothetical protein Rt10032_c18g6100 [Rhodotorula toruloides]